MCTICSHCLPDGTEYTQTITLWHWQEVELRYLAALAYVVHFVDQ